MDPEYFTISGNHNNQPLKVGSLGFRQTQAIGPSKSQSVEVWRSLGDQAQGLQGLGLLGVMGAIGLIRFIRVIGFIGLLGAIGLIGFRVYRVYGRYRACWV